MKVTRIDRRTAKMLSHELEKAATIIAEKYGLKVSKKSGSFDEMRHTARVEFSVGENADGKSSNQVDFDKYCSWYGLKPEHFGQKIALDGDTYTISGVRTKATKNTICIERVTDGKTFVVSEKVVQRILGIKHTDPFGVELPEVN